MTQERENVLNSIKTCNEMAKYHENEKKKALYELELLEKQLKKYDDNIKQAQEMAEALASMAMQWDEEFKPCLQVSLPLLPAPEPEPEPVNHQFICKQESESESKPDLSSSESLHAPAPAHEPINHQFLNHQELRRQFLNHQINKYEVMKKISEIHTGENPNAGWKVAELYRTFCQYVGNDINIYKAEEAHEGYDCYAAFRTLVYELCVSSMQHWFGQASKRKQFGEIAHPMFYNPINARKNQQNRWLTAARGGLYYYHPNLTIDNWNESQFGPLPTPEELDGAERIRNDPTTKIRGKRRTFNN